MPCPGRLTGSWTTSGGGKKAAVTCRQKKKKKRGTSGWFNRCAAPTSGEVFVLTDRSVVNVLHNNNADALRAPTVALLRPRRAR